MSMTVFLIGQMIGMFCAYFGVTALVPMVVFKRFLKHKSITNQILLSFLFGNFYIITMVQILQILKISYAPTLIIMTALPAFVTWVKLNDIPLKQGVETVVQNAKWLTGKQIGMKTVLLRIRRRIWRTLKRFFHQTVNLVVENFLEILLQLALFVILAWVYGKGIVQVYGYSASDIPVHNYWINAMGDNNIFVAGVYPHGYHCMIYYLHEVFGFDTYVLLSQFAFVQVICVHFALLYFLKLCCKSRYVPYIGAFLYALSNFFVSATYSRFASTLPQEFGMIFILPGIYYGFEFFKERYEEVKAGEKKKESWYSLFGFAMSFGLTLSAHFYNTIIAAFFCIAMAIGYLFLFVRKQYFGNVVITCLVSVLVAILPMGIAFATGTPLQGSLYWATEVIMGTGDEETEEVVQSTPTPETNVETNVDSGTTGKEQEDGAVQTPADTQLNVNSSDNSENLNNRPVVPEKSTQEKLSEKLDSLKDKIKKINTAMENYVWAEDAQWHAKAFWGLIIALIFMGLLYIVFRKTCYGAMLVSVAVYMAMMAVILSSGSLGLPKLMDPARTCIYFAYSLPILLVMPLDAVVYFIMGGGRFKWAGKIASFGCLTVFLVYLIGSGHVRSAFQAGCFETNEAVTCLTNIIRQEEDFMWTICSANDELRMGEDHGYHYETITFLKKMEKWDEDTIITIPTPKVYFFIEKVPLDYAVKYENSGQTISEEGASRKLSYSTGLTPYQGEQRWVTMSRMYYWAQEFQRMYPNEMKVYLETDEFVCYVVEQNAYSLFNFAIDYGYNTRK